MSFLFLPRFSTAVTLILKHPHDISKGRDGWCVHNGLDIFMAPMAEQSDLRRQGGEGLHAVTEYT